MKYVVTLLDRTVEVDVDGEHVTIDGTVVTASLGLMAGTPVRQLLFDGRAEALGIESLGAGRWALTRRGERTEVEVVDERTRHIRTLTGANDRPRGPAALKAPMPGLVVRIQVEAGQAVAAGAGVVVLEAMKMENELRAPTAGTVRTVRVAQGEAVEKGQVLVEFDPSS
ncbi:MAG TPA: biotin/lipoyl-containing protein [Gemmatimonadales bacterium]|nr:biotin/lipoyl-containing protein [Gemmatimonadales bacterium]